MFYLDTIGKSTARKEIDMKWRRTLYCSLAGLMFGAGLATEPAPAQYLGNSDNSPALAQQNSAQQGDYIRQWFSQYDEVRREAQMNPADRAKADNLLAKGMSIFIPGPEKIVTSQLLEKLVAKNHNAAEAMKQLRVYRETEKLHRGYYQYFTDAQTLFSDYLAVQNNILVPGADGKPLASQLLARKQGLEQLDQSNKALDAQLRQQFGIAPYRY